MIDEKGKKVFVGMSGGVDSSVSAALLRQAGYDVTGVFIKAWHPDFLACTWRNDRQDAMAVCAKLRIPFETCDLEAEYKRDVVDYLVREYTAGRTPNPDVMCNRHIKFGAFYGFARERGADYIAMGHYARTLKEGREVLNSKSKVSSSKYRVPQGTSRLLKGIDSSKDQSYFLWAADREALVHTLFPIGELTKTEVRSLAQNFGLSVATKKDSQGVCFLGHVSIGDFLKRFVDVVPGDVLNEVGQTIGRHDGALMYTIGQRHGFTVRVKKPDDGPLYVVSKDVDANTITVSHDGKVGMRFSIEAAVLRDVNWIADVPTDGTQLTCRFRYRQPLVSCTVLRDDGKTTVRFDTPQVAVTSGQSLVLYDGDECLGGGVIV